MKGKISKRTVEAVAPGGRDRFLWDTELRGFGCKVTPKGARIYILQYWSRGRAKRVTIGRHSETTTAEEARREANILRGRIAGNEDPAEQRAIDRNAPTLAEFADRYIDEHARIRKKPVSVSNDEYNLRNHILPELGRMKLTDISRTHVTKLHYGMRTKPYGANRCLALLSKMFNLAEKWGLRPDGTNPTRHVEKYHERKIERFLSEAELARLGQALEDAENAGEHPSVISAIRLLIFTGCRRDEILKLKWDYVDFEHACLRLPDSKTGAKLVSLGAPGLKLLAELPRVENNPYVLPGQIPGKHYVALEKAWRRLRLLADLPDVRLHDLRHSFASTAAGLGESLVLIGSLLGHANPSTTARYGRAASFASRSVETRSFK